MTPLRAPSLATALIVLHACVAYSQTPAEPVPDFKVQVWGYIVADFTARIDRYVELRAMLE